MAIETKIYDGEGSGIRAGVQQTADYGNGLKVYSYNPIIENSEGKYFTNDSFGFNMNQNVSFGGTPEEIHDGEDTALWTASIIASGAGDFIFNSTPTTPSPAGGDAIDFEPSENNDIAQFAKGSDITITDYVALTGYIYVTDWRTTGVKEVLIYLYDVGVGTVSATINIGDYINTQDFNTWQQFSIPISIFSATQSTCDAVRIQIIDNGGGPAPTGWLDQLQFEETGDPIAFEMGPPQGEVWSVQGLGWVIVDAFNPTLASSNMPGLPYDGILGVSSLPVGLTLQRLINGQVLFTNVIKDLIDIVGAPGIETTIISGSDGTNTWIKIQNPFSGGLILDGDQQDKFRITVNDDLSGLIRMRVFSRILNIRVSE